ncbi:MAG: hypothetical protein R3C02_19305 [Planctomycetaceae bacterium]
MDVLNLALVFVTLSTMMLIGSGVMFVRFYHSVPSGKVAVRNGVGGMVTIANGGVWVIPSMHRLDYVHSEVETFQGIFEGEQRDIVVQLKPETENIKRAHAAFGSKDREETRLVLQALIDSSHDIAELDSRLAELGYQRL